MQSLRGKIRLLSGRSIGNLDNLSLGRIANFDYRIPGNSFDGLSGFKSELFPNPPSLLRTLGTFSGSVGSPSLVPSCRGLISNLNQSMSIKYAFPARNMSTASPVEEDPSKTYDAPQRIKFKRLDKTARHIMQILDKEDVEGVRSTREIPDIRPGYIIQLKVEVPENRRRASVIKGIVIARRNAGLNSTFRLRRIVAGVGIESLFHLYSPNIKEIKILDKKKVRRAKLYYLRDKMNALRK